MIPEPKSLAKGHQEDEEILKVCLWVQSRGEYVATAGNINHEKEGEIKVALLLSSFYHLFSLQNLCLTKPCQKRADARGEVQPSCHSEPK